MTDAPIKPTRIKVLCVDDEPQVLEGLGLHLRRKYELLTATRGADALELLAIHPDITVVISDMRMPQMDGATFLAKARYVAPAAVRMLLTGQTDLSSAIAAVNEGQIFRFLTKPASPATVQAAVAAAVEQHRLITAERVLLEQTLLGATKTLADVLALANPIAFGRSTRVKQLVVALAGQLQIADSWQLEMAAMFSQLGTVSLPEVTIDRMHRGDEPSDEERAMIARSHALTDELLGQIPRLETVRAIITNYAKPAPAQWRAAATNDDPLATFIERGADLLRIATDYDSFETKDGSPGIALDTLRGRAKRYDPVLLEALGRVRGAAQPRHEVRELNISALRVGMVFLDDVKLKNGMLLVVRGYEITPSFLERIRNHADNLKEPLRVMMRPTPQAAHG